MHANIHIIYIDYNRIQIRQVTVKCLVKKAPEKIDDKT